MDYVRNRECACLRCRSAGFMGPAVLVTLGVLFLLQEFTRIEFDDSWPVLLIVIGLVKVLQWNTSAEGHVNPGAPFPAAMPPSAAANISAPAANPTDQQVSNG